jgi:hypothetical protein
LSGDDAFHGLFDSELWKEIDAYGTEWLALTGDLRAKPPDNAEELSSLLTALRSNNAKWMNIGATQFTKAVARYCQLE